MKPTLFEEHRTSKLSEDEDGDKKVEMYLRKKRLSFRVFLIWGVIILLALLLVFSAISG